MSKMKIDTMRSFQFLVQMSNLIQLSPYEKENLYGHELWLKGDKNWNRLNMSKMQFPYHDFSNSNLEKANMECMNLYGADFSYTNLKDTKLMSTDLREVNFTGVINFEKADLRETKLDKVKGIEMISFQNVGIFKRSIYYFPNYDILISNCFQGTFEESKEAVKKMFSNQPSQYRDYMDAILSINKLDISKS